ncbi:MAG: hypothetical protein BWY74_02319 [Firmicutes bacterium ADurb.Bin419]|nr:MAG: hypothetical protein BWY74_02319 [Firmicutes bacterium ADurb.Bin419]
MASAKSYVPESGFCTDKSTLPSESAVNQAKDSNAVFTAQGKHMVALIFTFPNGDTPEILILNFSSQSAIAGSTLNFISMTSF